MKFLIIFLPGLGNAVLLEPMLRTIKDKYPDCHLELYIKEKIVKELYAHSGLIDDFIFYGKFSLKKYDVLISTSSTLGWKEKLFAYLLRTDKKINYQQVGYTEKIHEVDCRLRLLEPLGVSVTRKKPKIYIPEQIKNFLPKTNQLTIGFHPGCSQALKFKRWPAERFAQVAQAVQRKYQSRVILFGGPEEVELSQKIANMMKARPLILTGRTKILETAKAIGNCDLFITNDSGLMHVASAMGVPIVAIFGRTNAVKNAPLVDPHIILQNNDLKKVSIRRVLNAVYELQKNI